LATLSQPLSEACLVTRPVLVQGFGFRKRDQDYTITPTQSSLF
jgi:hypothetical protein